MPCRDSKFKPRLSMPNSEIPKEALPPLESSQALTHFTVQPTSGKSRRGSPQMISLVTRPNKEDRIHSLIAGEARLADQFGFRKFMMVAIRPLCFGHTKESAMPD